MKTKITKIKNVDVLLVILFAISVLLGWLGSPVINIFYVTPILSGFFSGISFLILIYFIYKIL